MLNKVDIQEQIVKYVSGGQSFEDFEDWLAERTRFNFPDNPADIRGLIGEANLLIVDFLDGEFSEDTLKNKLLAFAIDHSPTFRILAIGEGVALRQEFTSSASQTLHPAPLRISLAAASA